VAVAPIRFGSGTRLKVLEALAMQKPVVSTRLGYEGLELRDSEHLLRADSAADFAARIGWVFTHPQQAAAMGTRGRRQVASLYAWPAIASTLESWYRELLDGRRQRKSA
jgi:glycosyltransferase involved in cell wall biosynthesis